MFNAQTLFDNLDVSNSLDWQFDFNGALDSPRSIVVTLIR